VLKNYPTEIELLSITGVAHLLTNNNNKALSYFLQAEKLNPKDYIVLNNIAKTYAVLGDKSKAIKYYELAAKFGDATSKEMSAEAIQKLKKE
jgi:Flp pilus assembly protein TadD